MKILTEFFEETWNNDQSKGVAEAALNHLKYCSECAMKYTMFVSKLQGYFQFFRDFGKERMRMRKSNYSLTKSTIRTP